LAFLLGSIGDGLVNDVTSNIRGLLFLRRRQGRQGHEIKGM